MQVRRETVEPFPPGGRNERPERSIGSLFADLARETSLLLRQEVALAKAEIGQKAGQLGLGAGIIVAGGLIAFAGLIILLGAATLALAKVVEPWLAALIVGVATILIGAILAYVGKKRMEPGRLVPERTIRTLRDDKDWAKEQVR